MDTIRSLAANPHFLDATMPHPSDKVQSVPNNKETAQ